jgi:hypothetical protein
MSIRVGDPIVRMRALGPDPCGVLPVPTGVSLAAAAGGVLPAQTVYVVQTWTTPWGETSGSAEQTIDLSVGNQTVVATSTLIPGVIKARLYIGTQPGQQSQFQELDVSLLAPGATVVITVDGTMTTPSRAPQVNRAYVPDSDGTFVPASLAFSWLNQALRQMIVNLGGIADISGVAWPSGAAWQALNNRWTEIENLWWQGWWQVRGDQAYTWLQSPVQSVPGYFTPWSTAGQDIIGLWPQPGAGPPTTALAANMGINDTSFTCTTGSLSSFNAPGLCQIDEEMILVSTQDQTDSIFQGCLRGIGGTVAAPHAIGATVTQLIVMFTGKRLAPEFVPGAAYAGLALPAGWDAPLDIFLVSKFREKEQDSQGAVAKMQEFNAMVEQLRSSRDAVPKGWSPGDARVYEAFAGYRASYPFSILWK